MCYGLTLCSTLGCDDNFSGILPVKNGAKRLGNTDHSETALSFINLFSIYHVSCKVVKLMLPTQRLPNLLIRQMQHVCNMYDS